MTMQGYLQTLAQMQATVMQHCSADYVYSSAADYVLDRGEWMSSDTPLTSAEFDQLTQAAVGVYAIRGAEFGALKTCFDSSMLLACEDTDIRYCEGFAVAGSGLPVPHAWNMLGDKLIDLTRSLRPEAVDDYLAGKPPQRDLRDRVLGVVPEGWEYLGVSFSRQDVLDYIDASEQTGSLIDDYPRRHPLYRQARRGHSPAPIPLQSFGLQ